MATLLLRRLAQAIPLLLLVSVAVFALIHAAPGGPTAVFLSNPGVRPEDIERLRRALGVDQPLWLQYVRWLTAFVRGDWGYSFSDSRPVIDRVIERAPATLELVGCFAGHSSDSFSAFRDGRGRYAGALAGSPGSWPFGGRHRDPCVLVGSRLTAAVRIHARMAALVWAHHAR